MAQGPTTKKKRSVLGMFLNRWTMLIGVQLGPYIYKGLFWETYGANEGSWINVAPDYIMQGHDTIFSWAGSFLTSSSPPPGGGEATNLIFGLVEPNTLLLIGAALLASYLVYRLYRHFSLTKEERKAKQDARKDAKSTREEWRQIGKEVNENFVGKDYEKRRDFWLAAGFTTATVISGIATSAAFASAGTMFALLPLCLGALTAATLVGAVYFGSKAMIKLWQGAPEEEKIRFSTSLRAPLDKNSGYPKKLYEEVKEKKRAELKAEDEKRRPVGAKQIDLTPEQIKEAEADFERRLNDATAEKMNEAINAKLAELSTLFSSIATARGYTVPSDATDQNKKRLKLYEALATKAKFGSPKKVPIDGRDYIRVVISNNDGTTTTLTEGPYGLIIDGALKKHVIEPLLDRIEVDYEGKIIFGDNMTEADKRHLYNAAMKRNEADVKAGRKPTFSFENLSQADMDRFEDDRIKSGSAASGFDKLVDDGVWYVDDNGNVKMTWSSWATKWINNILGAFTLWIFTPYDWRPEPVRDLKPPSGSKYAPAPA